MKLDGRHAVVTGGAMGIGFAVAARLVRTGCSVSIWDINPSVLHEAVVKLKALAGPAPKAQVHGQRCDVTDADHINAAVHQSEDSLGPIDILVNNAGYMAPGTFLERDPEEWVRTVDINLTSIIRTTHAVLPGMYERNLGHIVNISSASSLLGVPGLSVYAATKWGVWGLTESLRAEAWNAAKRGVRFSSVHPNFVATGMFEGARLRGVGNLISPRVKSHDVVARAVVESALRRGRYSPKRPRSLRLAILFRGLLPDFLLQRFFRGMGVHASMQGWTGRREELS